jgi:hypothetical protein
MVLHAELARAIIVSMRCKVARSGPVRARAEARISRLVPRKAMDRHDGVARRHP